MSMTDPVTPYLKAYAALVGSIVTALIGSGLFTDNATVTLWLTIGSIIATAFATFRVPYMPPVEPTTAAQEPREEPLVDKSELAPIDPADGPPVAPYDPEHRGDGPAL